jgi:enoyl-CoA hydratase/carnithine racemase
VPTAVDAGVTTVTMIRPEAPNALDAAMPDGLRAAGGGVAARVGKRAPRFVGR